MPIPTSSLTSSEASPSEAASDQIPEPMSVVPLLEPSSTTSSPNQIHQTTLGVQTSSTIQVLETATKESSSSLEESYNSSNVTKDPNNISSLEPSAPSTVNVDTFGSPTPTEGLSTSSPNSVRTSSTIDRHTASTSNHPKTQSNKKNSWFRNFQFLNHLLFLLGSVYSYRPRPGIVLDDTLDYAGTQGLATHRPYPVPPQRHPTVADTFDVVVSAIQGPGGASTGIKSESTLSLIQQKTVKITLNLYWLTFLIAGEGGVKVPISAPDDILTSPVEGQGFVSIDGKRTYLNLFDSTEKQAGPSKVPIHPSKTQTPGVIGTGYVTPSDQAAAQNRPIIPPSRRPIFYKRPTQPPVRIDTCIVGDPSTCDTSQHEACATVHGVSACHCKPGFARPSHSLPCKSECNIIWNYVFDISSTGDFTFYQHL